MFLPKNTFARLLITTFLLFTKGVVSAQFCNSLGDPVFTEPFNDNNGSFTSSFSFTASCPQPGSYTLGGIAKCADLFLAGPNDVISFDSSNLLLVNAQNHTGIVYQKRFDNLCESNDYQFAMTVKSYVNKGGCNVSPNLTMLAQNLNGDTLGIYQTGIVATVKQFGLCFSTRGAVPQTVIVSIISTTTTDCFFVFGIDDIRLRPAKLGSFLEINSSNINDDYINVCADYTKNYFVHVNISSFTNPQTVWQISTDPEFVKTWQDMPGTSGDTLTIPHNGPGTTFYRLQVAEENKFSRPQCRINSTYLRFTVYPQPPHEPLVNLLGCLNRSVELKTLDSGKTYTWQGPRGALPDNSRAITIKNLQYKDSGLYTVNVKDVSPCGLLDSFYVVIQPSPGLVVPSSYTVCEGSAIKINASADGAFKWVPSYGLSASNISSPLAFVTDTTSYKVYAKNDKCTDSAIVKINVIKKVEVNAGPDKYVILGDTVTLKASLKGTVSSYKWLPDNDIADVNVLQPLIKPNADKIYTLTAVSPNNCSAASDDVKVFVYNDIYIPNAFTPNGDGLNDVFRVLPYNGYIVSRVTVYNRWGKEVFNTAIPGQEWDGTLNGQQQPAGTYIFYVKITSPQGKTTIKQGTVILIR